MVFKIIGIKNGIQRVLIVSASIIRSRAIVNDLIAFDNRFDSFKIVRAR